MEPCWLCSHTHTQDAKTLSSFIAENAGCASAQCIAVQVAEDLQDRFPEEPGTSVEAVLRHIECHTLHPTFRIATMLRGLLKLSDDLGHSLRQCDEEGRVTLDPKQVETYLKVQSQIMQIYRTSETNKLLFADKGV
jgi:hypothetical protein